MIYELPIYDGALKNWRVLNLSTGTFYSPSYETRELAEASIEDGTQRGKEIVQRIHLGRIQYALHNVNLPIEKTDKLNGSYVVMRDHNNKGFAKVLSRPIKDMGRAKDWLDFCADEKANKRHLLFLVQYVDIDERMNARDKAHREKFPQFYEKKS